ncbi:MAG: hypothetical protein ACRDQI_13725 [Pseudonocardiaceae bacterium]
MGVPDNVLDRLALGGELPRPLAGCTVLPVRHELCEPTSTILPSRPARTSDGRQTLARNVVRNVVRRTAAPLREVNTSPATPGG